MRVVLSAVFLVVFLVVLLLCVVGGSALDFNLFLHDLVMIILVSLAERAVLRRCDQERPKALPIDNA